MRLVLLSIIFILIGCRDRSVQNDNILLIYPFNKGESSLEEMGLPAYPYQKTIEELLKKQPPEEWEQTKVNKDRYLDMMEKIVRNASKWVNDKGAVIDPYFKEEFGQTTPRFVSSAAILLYFGRIQDLKPLVIRSMTYSCRQLANGKANSPDFWMRELTTAYACLDHIMERDLLESWKNLISQVDPEKTYREIDISGEALDKLNNWTVYSSCGEYLREAFGLTPSDSNFLYGSAFFDKYMDSQLIHFTKEGMYRDPNDPITYDITTRLQIANALAYGYDGDLKEQYDELLRRGGMTMLLFTSPEGYVPFGGRSGQFQFQEAIIAALSELEAKRYKESNERLAGAFKRQAHNSAMAIERWILDMEPLRHIKNGFDPESEHGIDGYGKYSVYSLYCASVLGLATLYADDEITEYSCPSELGGYLIELYPAFHKVIATVQGSHIEIDTQADPHFEATGLGRFHVKGVPLELGLNMSFTDTPKYKMEESLKPGNDFAIGPAWMLNGEMFTLAGRSQGLIHILDMKQINEDTIEFSIEYADSSFNKTTIRQDYKLSRGELNITSWVNDLEKNIDSTYFIIPLLVSDGKEKSELIEGKEKITIKYKGHSYLIKRDQDAEYKIDTQLFANRNGIYQNLIFQRKGNPIKVSLKLE